jgi:hypothetical protein
MNFIINNLTVLYNINLSNGNRDNVIHSILKNKTENPNYKVIDVRGSYRG